jgi:hypothetical protein
MEKKCMLPKSVNFNNTTRRRVPEGDNFTVTDGENFKQGSTNLQYAPNGISNQDANIEESEVLRKRKNLVRDFITYT